MGTYSDKLTERLKGKAKPAKLSAEASAALVDEVRENVQAAFDYDQPNIEAMARDQRFRANDQWPQAARAQREADGRPCPTHNRLNTFVNQVVNPIRQADKAIKAKPDDNTADPTLAKVVDGLFRKIQRQSMAGVVFGHWLDCQAGCSIGWVRVCNDYRNSASFDQDIYIEKIDSPMSVFVDPAARDPVRSDAMWMGVTEVWPVATFKARWPDAAEESADSPLSNDNSDFFWRGEDGIRVVEYFKKIPVTKSIAKLADGNTKDITDMDEAQAVNIQAVDVREVKTYRVEKYMVSGSEVLEGPTEVPGCYIPLVPAIGGEVALEKGVYRYSVIRFTLDAQMEYNLTRAAMSERVGQTPKAPYLATPKMIAQHREMWQSLNTKTRNFLLYTPDKDAPGMRPERIDPPDIGPGLISLAEFASEDMKSGANVHDSSLGRRSNETSGVAIDARKIQDDVANYHFADNFEASLTHLGKIMMEWIPIIYDTPRTILLVGEDGTEHPTPINTPQMDPQTGETVIVNDLSNVKFGVQVTIGPSFATRRAQAATQVGEIVKLLPPPQQVAVSDIFVRNQDFDGNEEMAKRLKAMVPPEVLAASQTPDGQPPPPAPPNPEIMAKLQLIAAQIEDTKASAAKKIVEAKQLDRQDLIMDFPGNQMAVQPSPGQMDRPDARPNYLQ